MGVENYRHGNTDFLEYEWKQIHNREEVKWKNLEIMERQYDNKRLGK